MHGDKKWIYDHSGKLKKSSDRTFKDWCGDLNRSWKVLRDEEAACPDCIENKQHLGKWVQPRRWDYLTKEFYVDKDNEYFYTPPEAECKYHRELDEKKGYGVGCPYSDIRRYWYRSGVPAWFRRDLNRNYRSKTQQLMQRAKFNEDLYDDLPQNQHDAA